MNRRAGRRNSPCTSWLRAGLAATPIWCMLEPGYCPGANRAVFPLRERMACCLRAQGYMYRQISRKIVAFGRFC